MKDGDTSFFALAVTSFIESYIRSEMKISCNEIIGFKDLMEGFKTYSHANIEQQRVLALVRTVKNATDKVRHVFGTVHPAVVYKAVESLKNFIDAFNVPSKDAFQNIFNPPADGRTGVKFQIQQIGYECRLAQFRAMRPQELAG